MSVIFRVLGAELRFTFCWALTDPSVALNNGPNMAAVAILNGQRLMILLSRAEKNATHYPFFAKAIPIG
jgi:hypothetical protein